MTKTAVSIIILTNNNQFEIAKTLAILAQQIHKDFEVIIIDFCSTDHTIQYAKSFPVKIFRLSANETNLFRAINHKIPSCIGNIIFCLSGSCIPKYSNFLSVGTKILKSERISLLTGRGYRLKEAPHVRLISGEMFVRPDQHSERIESDDIHKITTDVFAFRKNLWQLHPFPEGNLIDFWNWSYGMMGKGYLFFRSPALSVMSRGKTGLINYLRERRLNINLAQKALQANRDAISN